jgi:hypothetical protein
MDEAEIELLARARVEATAGREMNAYWGDPYLCHLAGVRGEVWIADRYNLGYDDIRRNVGVGADGGADFKVYFGGRPVTFDVKTRYFGGFDLLVKDDKFKHSTVADFFIVGFALDKRVNFFGWEDSRLVRAEPCQGLKVPTHVRRLEHLRPMWQLDSLMQKRDGAKRRA